MIHFMATTRTISIVQPFVPHYRVPFFERLATVLSQQGVRLQVLVPATSTGLHGPDGRGDASRRDHDWLLRVATSTELTIGRRRLESMGRAIRPMPGDGVILGLQASLPDTWRLVVPPGRQYRVGLWGHVGAFVAPPNPVDVAAERWLMRRSDHVFAYTEHGAEIARRVIPASQVTTVHNSVDTSFVDHPGRAALVEDLRRHHGLEGDRHLGYVGGLDSSKRIDFLVDALDELYRMDPTVRLLVAGDGRERDLLRRAEARGQVIRLGFGTDQIKGALAELCSAFLMPGRIGLVAVDVLAMGRPLISVEGSRHGPEHAYLVEGESLFTTADDPHGFSRTALAALDRPRQVWPHPTLESMVSNFADGAMRLLDAPLPTARRPRSQIRGAPRPQAAWVTNFDAPYRRPVWDRMARMMELTVMLTGDASSVEARARGTDWFLTSESRAYRIVPAATRSRNLLGVDLAFARRSAPAALPTNGSVVLGGWESPVYWQIARQARRRGNRVVGFYESTATSQRFRRGPIAEARKHYFRSLDAVVVPGLQAASAVTAMGVPAHRIHVGMNPIEVEKFRQAAERRDSQPLHSPRVGHRFVYVGQLIARKNVTSLIEAFERIAAKGDTLSIVGSGPLLLDLKQQTRRSPQVTFVPHVPYDEVPDLLAEQHTLVLPSTEEVWGLVVNEALAAGLHTVVSVRAGVSSSVDGMDGVWLSQPDTTSLAAAMDESRRSWSGWIHEPEIRRHTPARFAEVVTRALGL